MSGTDSAVRAVRRLQKRVRERMPHVWAGHPVAARRILPWAEHLHALRAKVRPYRPIRPLELVVYELSQALPEARFVQVGAHDGTQLDPLRESILGARWSGIMVEPVPYVFDRLAARYRSNPRIALENVAVSDVDGTREFYFLDEAGSGDDVWKWYDALGSFKREVVVSHTELVGDIEERVRSTDVPCVTFATLCTRNGFDHVDLVLIDTEGYDRDVLELIDFDRFRPSVVIFEHLHLDDDAREACRSLLERHGFQQVSDGMDTIAVTDVALAFSGVRSAFAAAKVALAEFKQ